MQNLIQKPGERLRRRRGSSYKIQPELMLKLSELLQGERDMIKVYSRAFNSDICFINPAVCDPSTLPTDCPVYTTRELAHVLSLSPEEFRRFHGVKKQRV